MQLKKNEREILKLLLSSTDYISSYDIATATGINRRIVRDEMAYIKTNLKKHGYNLISKTSKGYMIEGKSPNALASLQKAIEEAELQRESVFPTLPWERSNYIIKRLIEANDYIKIDDLANELLISRSTISCDIKRCKQDIKKYNLTLKQKPNYGLCVVGDEASKRKPICDFTFTNLNQSEMYYDYLDNYFADKDSLEYGIIDIIKKHQVELSDYALCDFLISLSITISRILYGCCIDEPQDLSLIEGRPEFTVANDIAKFIENRISCHINQYEINQIAIQLICKRSTTGLSPTHDPSTLQLVDEILDEIEKQTCLSFHNDSFRSTFDLYVENALIRSFYREKVRNPFYNSMNYYTPLGYECALITSSVIYKHTHKYLSSSELAYFAIIFHKSIFNEKLEKKKTLLICGLGGGTGSLCKATILDSFQDQIEIVNVIPFYKFYDEDLSQYDLIISTSAIHKKLPIPCINISPLIDQEDLNKIKNFLFYFFNQNKMKKLFHPKLFKSHIKAKNKNEINNEFYKILKTQYPSTKESFKNTLTNKCYVSYTDKGINVIKLDKPINNNNILIVLITDKPVRYDQELLSHDLEGHIHRWFSFLLR